MFLSDTYNIPYEGIIIRPPNEADSLILQVTVGCSHNQCTFCPAYKEKRFRIRPRDEIHAMIDKVAAREAASVRRVFLCDGDALIMGQAQLEATLDHLALRFPRLQRIGIYGNAKSILRKSCDELAALRSRKLAIVYMGLESGDQQTLDRVHKGADIGQMIEAAGRIRAAGIKLNVTVLLGLGGRQRSQVHARETMRVLNSMRPHHVAALTLMLVPGTPLYEEQESGGFHLPDKFELLAELRTMLADSRLEQCLFFSNHASNYLPLQARLARDQKQMLALIDGVLESRNEAGLRREFMRAL